MHTISFKVVRLLTLFCSALILSNTYAASQLEEQKDWPRALRVGTASIGGTYYAYGSAWTKLVEEKVKIQTTAQATGGPLQNIPLVSMGDMEFGQAVMVDAYEGYKGEGWAKGKGTYQNIRAVFPMYPSYWHFWANKETGIEQIGDLNGKRLIIGPIGGTPDIQARRFLPLFDIKPNAMINAAYGDANQLMRDGQADANFTTSGIPHPAAIELQTNKELNIFGIEGELAEKYLAVAPLAKCSIPANTYKQQTQSIDTVCGWDVVFTNKDMADELVYQVVKSVLENNSNLVAGHAAAKNTLAENVKFIGIPLHRGAARYYKELGLVIPAAAMPID
ncbi:TAXI family TRAP transporter solute-binding subunit [Alcaligenaceae bacterium CGII-47]|nr:TAXI family TRAP transporter solute-binding subunit [Alcaligenaceae bacterium CGII-47]